MTKQITFDFGRNWQQFSAVKLNAQRLRDAALSLKASLGEDTIQGRTFLDVGCGSGLFSIAAAQCGASQVLGFDVNTMAVETSRQNAERFGDDLKSDVIPEFVLGDILEQGFLEELGTFDVVYAWGSLHHTGRMWQAIRNAESLVDPADGVLVIAIYNRHWTSPIWRLIKRLYNSSPTVVRTLLNYVFAVMIYIGIWLTTGENPLHKERGMDFWFDVIDWLGGYPYEYASIAEVINFTTTLGFQCEQITRPRVWTGCNEFVLRRSGSPRDTLFDKDSRSLQNLSRNVADGDTRIKIAYVIDNLSRDGTQTALMYLVEGLTTQGMNNARTA